MFKLIKPCAVVVTLWLSVKTLVPMALPCKMETFTVTASFAITTPPASRSAAWYLNASGVWAKMPVTASNITANTNVNFFIIF